MSSVSTLDTTRKIADWATRPVRKNTPPRANAITVDIEDYFQVEAFNGLITRDQWDGFECRVERNVDRILELFASADVKGTFFTLGWIARRYPALVRRIADGGHEIASHGSMHFRAADQTPAVFANDVREAKAVLEDIVGTEVKGYRAPSFSITRESLWVFDVLNQAGYRYSSSTYPIAHDLYGIPEAPRFAFYPIGDSEFIEIPVTAVRFLNRNWPCGGGGYFRLLPYGWSKFGLRRVNRRDEEPCMFYFHPWEIDPGQPRVEGAPIKSRLRHYTNLGSMERRLKKLLDAFAWGRIDMIYPIAGVTQ
ncbi:MAG: DUF3473 domain-containing protein [Alphaproteobacteria bacterium]|nr:DUF3473 domain-containing protein [Alphaproteobacteria bacterium]